MTALTAARVKCPRCDRPLVRNHDELVCLTHGQAYEAIRAWENVPVYEPVPGRPRQPPRAPVVPWTEDERELWRRADAGEVFDLAPDHEEEEPMTEGMIQTVDALAKPTLARLKEIVGEIESTKSVGELFAPVNGTVVEANEAVVADPSIVNSDPFGDGWLIEAELSDAGELGALLSDAEEITACRRALSS